MLPAATIIPSEFGPDFLDWFRERTEGTWAAIRASTPDEELDRFVKAGVGGENWQRGTRWRQGLTDAEIAEVERHWRLSFPPDHRLFLQRLHTVDQPMRRAHYLAGGPSSEDASSQLATAYVARNGQYMALEEAPSFFDWQRDTDALASRFAWLWEGIEFDIEHNALWSDSRGPQPAILAEQKARARELVEAAPRLIPIFSHRYLLAEPCVAGNPVLSVYQSDIIVYGADLREYLLIEFADLLRLSATQKSEIERISREKVAARYADFCATPFWGEFL